MPIKPLPGGKILADAGRVGKGPKSKRPRRLFPNTPKGRAAAAAFITDSQRKGHKPSLGDEWRSFEEAYDYFTSRTKFMKLTPETRQKYAFRLKGLVDFATSKGKAYLHEFTQKDAEAYAKTIILKNKGKGIESRLELAYKFFSVEIDRDDATISRNPFREVERYGYYEPEVPAPVEGDDLEFLISYLTPKELAIIMLHYGGGFRSNELHHLRWTNVQPDRTEIRPHRDFKPKKNRVRDVGHNDITRAAFGYFRNITGHLEYVIGGEKPCNRNYIQKMLFDAKRRIWKLFPDKDLSFIKSHRMRKTFSSLAYRDPSIRPGDIADTMGNTLAVLKKHYAQNSFDNYQKVSDAVRLPEAIFGHFLSKITIPETVN